MLILSQLEQINKEFIEVDAFMTGITVHKATLQS